LDRVSEGRTPSSLPWPEGEMLRRIGPADESDPIGGFEASGARHRGWIEELLPDDWTWEGRRTLDFGCGVGRILRQFAPESGRAEFWGCDLDRPTIEWDRRNLEPPFHFLSSGEDPGLDRPDGFFDLIYCFSVYTHFTDNWAPWMVEHHRLLADGGYLLITFLGEGMSKALIDEEWDEERTGMNALLHGNSWDLGGPVAFNSEWWIRAHWGRGFEIVALRPHEGGDPPAGHGVAMLRKKPVALSVEELTRLEPDEPREVLALQHNLEQLRDDTLRLRADIAHRERLASAERESFERRQRQAIEDLTQSASWRITRPLRDAKARLQRGGR
jgi:SAM-dependent methyltransferase